MNATTTARLATSSYPLTARARRLRLPAIIVGLVALPTIALGDPPSWAPAHGWRAKNDPSYAGYSGHSWDHDYGIRSGFCDRAGIGAVIGGVTGGVIGSQVGKDGNRAVATVLGSVVGAVIGAEIGRQLDKTDRYCVGHALELAAPGQTVSWTNRNTGVSYQLTPNREDASRDGCRKFRLIATGSFGLSQGRAFACPGDDGTWALAPDVQLGQR
jgi:surface antigen